MRIPKYFLNLAGEYRICSELNKRGIFATVTYGNLKGVDVYAIGGREALKIEVKTSQEDKFVTGIAQKKGLLDNGPDAPDFWVLFQILPARNGTFEEHFFVMSHQQICAVQKERNKAYAEKYFARYGKQFDISRGG